MKKILSTLFLSLFFLSSAFSMTEEEYWETYGERMIENSNYCIAESERISGSFNSELFHQCRDAYSAADKIRLEMIRKNKEQRCSAMRQKIENNKNYNAGSDAANFLMGMLNSYMEDEACGY